MSIRFSEKEAEERGFIKKPEVGPATEEAGRRRYQEALSRSRLVMSPALAYFLLFTIGWLIGFGMGLSIH